MEIDKRSLTQRGSLREILRCARRRTEWSGMTAHVHRCVRSLRGRWFENGNRHRLSEVNWSKVSVSFRGASSPFTIHGDAAYYEKWWLAAL